MVGATQGIEQLSEQGKDRVSVTEASSVTEMEERQIIYPQVLGGSNSLHPGYRSIGPPLGPGVG